MQLLDDPDTDQLNARQMMLFHKGAFGKTLDLAFPTAETVALHAAHANTGIQESENAVVVLEGVTAPREEQSANEAIRLQKTYGDGSHTAL